MAVLGALILTGSAAAEAKPSPTPHPTVVLVHGAFADSSGWGAVIAKLQQKDYPVIAVANPLRGLDSDTEYLRSVLSTIEGPIVLVGHSYGGAVITNAAVGDLNVKSLVYIAGYALQEGERALEANNLGGGTSDFAEHLIVRPYPGAAEGDGDVYVDPSFFGQLFAADLPAKATATLAAAQRPVAFSALLAPSGVAAWASIPSWYLVASNDKAIPPEAERAMAARAGSTTVEIRSSHAAMISHPNEVTQMILNASK